MKIRLSHVSNSSSSSFCIIGNILSRDDIITGNFDRTKQVWFIINDGYMVLSPENIGFILANLDNDIIRYSIIIEVTKFFVDCDGSHSDVVTQDCVGRNLVTRTLDDSYTGMSIECIIRNYAGSYDINLTPVKPSWSFDDSPNLEVTTPKRKLTL